MQLDAGQVRTVQPFLSMLTDGGESVFKESPALRRGSVSAKKLKLLQ